MLALSKIYLKLAKCTEEKFIIYLKEGESEKYCVILLKLKNAFLDISDTSVV